jgi:hypothetical protein
MSLAEILKDAQRINTFLMEDVYDGKKSANIALDESDNNFMNVFRQFGLLYKSEKNYYEKNPVVKKIIEDLSEQKITVAEAAIQIDSIWIDWINKINKLRNPGKPILNTSSLPKIPIFNF